MIISVRSASDRPSDLAWIEQQLPRYLEDQGLSAGSGVFRVLPEYGHAGPDQLRGWLSEPGATLFTIVDGREPAGFALVLARPSGSPGVDYRMAEFYIARELRRRGFGRSAARLILDRFGGRWEIIQNQRNTGAVAFWRRTLAQYTRGNYREAAAHGEVRQLFGSQR